MDDKPGVDMVRRQNRRRSGTHLSCPTASQCHGIPAISGSLSAGRPVLEPEDVRVIWGSQRWAAETCCGAKMRFHSCVNSRKRHAQWPRSRMGSESSGFAESESPSTRHAGQQAIVIVPIVSVLNLLGACPPPFMRGLPTVAFTMPIQKGEVAAKRVAV